MSILYYLCTGKSVTIPVRQFQLDSRAAQGKYTNISNTRKTWKSGTKKSHLQNNSINNLTTVKRKICEMIIFLGIKIVPFGLIQFTKEKASCQEHNRINKTKNTQITRHCITEE